MINSSNFGEPLSNTTEWFVELLMGSLGMSMAVLALAAVGLAMLHGRLSVRETARVALGCFILFGAPTIARGLAGLASSVTGTPAQVYNTPPPPIAVPTAPQPNRDPYAGASVPM
ncbi:TrbC/VirB2 family protein [Novosphingobium mangrovi (ex Huang et al. 2023)]|uniref:TrbC/VirB2 family protein n=1 Tax=Novosphingobium mangrovi (ex Huang et al. 2023) TaxID=2976432 RepID=A0ABT2IAJ8_9SPHN|nr:TrbC/VirB2 family protein [Novosphingobium mangrovi (ex Huang et al. 2023)]MCT2401850.1 TrbC/VirB2 family protein [Novosphingobium mangrovi (ex Huang et al. 2023)]